MRFTQIHFLLVVLVPVLALIYPKTHRSSCLCVFFICSKKRRSWSFRPQGGVRRVDPAGARRPPEKRPHLRLRATSAGEGALLDRTQHPPPPTPSNRGDTSPLPPTTTDGDTSPPPSPPPPEHLPATAAEHVRAATAATGGHLPVQLGGTEGQPPLPHAGGRPQVQLTPLSALQAGPTQAAVHETSLPLAPSPPYLHLHHTPPHHRGDDHRRPLLQLELPADDDDHHHNNDHPRLSHFPHACREQCCPHHRESYPHP